MLKTLQFIKIMRDIFDILIGINQEKIGIFQDVGEKNWWKSELPENTRAYDSLETLLQSDSKAYLIISDKIFDQKILKNSIVYRPKTLVVGIGLHGDTSKEKIKESLDFILSKHRLALKSVARLVSIKKPIAVKGLIEAAKDLQLKVEYFDRDELANIKIPNPSQMVEAYEGTPSVSEAAAIKSSGGALLVQKQKFPPDLTIASILKLEREIVFGEESVKVDSWQKSSVEGIWAAGEVTGIGGHELAISEGKVAALDMLEKNFATILIKFKRFRQRLFARGLAKIYEPPKEWIDWSSEDFVVCRCEEVSKSEIIDSFEKLGADSARTSKLFTRAGMGMCQGLFCHRNVSDLAERFSDKKSGIASVTRPIGGAVTLGELSD